MMKNEKSVNKQDFARTSGRMRGAAAVAGHQLTPKRSVPKRTFIRRRRPSRAQVREKHGKIVSFVRARSRHTG